jgi:glycosyltransferase involved in cell wall biosynthesis
MWKALESSGCKVELFDKIPIECPIAIRLMHNFYKRIKRRPSHHLGFEPAVLEKAAKRIERRFRESDCDAVFCPGTGYPVSTYISQELPVISYRDLSNQTWFRFYFGWQNFSKRTRRQAAEVDRIGLTNNTLTVFSSKWAASLAMKETGVPPDKIAIIPFGANINNPPSREEVDQMIRGRDISCCRVLFLGKDWERKGGKRALRLVSLLRSRGVAAELDVIGCTPSIPDHLSKFVRVHGFVDKASAAGQSRLRDLFANSLFLVMLSTADASPLVLCEANCYGVPCIATAVGGIPEIITANVNGILASSVVDDEEVARWLVDQIRSKDSYMRIARSARSEFEKRLNWSVSGQQLRSAIERAIDLCKAKSKQPSVTGEYATP